MGKKLFGISSNTSTQQHHNVHQPTSFMVVDDPSILQGFYNSEQQQQNQQQQTFLAANTNNANNGGVVVNLGGLTQQQQQLLNQFASSSSSTSTSNNNNNGMQQGSGYSSSIPNSMNSNNGHMNTSNNNSFSSFGINNNLFITTSNNQMNNNNMNNSMNTTNMNNNLMMNNNNNNINGGTPFISYNNNNSNNMFRLDDHTTSNNSAGGIGASVGSFGSRSNNNTFLFGQGGSSSSNSTSIGSSTSQQQQQQQPFIVNSSNNSISLSNETANKKYAPNIKWSLAPSTAYSFSMNQSANNMVNNEADNIMSQTLDPVFGPDDCKVPKGAQLTNTKLFCLSDQITRDFQYLRPSVQTDNLYHLTEMENESTWLPNDRIAPKKTTHNCLVNDWLVFCSQDPQLLKLVGRYINNASNTAIQLFADFVLVTSNNHDEDSRESLFGKQRFKGGIPLQMKLVRNSANNANMTPLLYFEKRINRESVNNKDAPSASGMGGKRVAQLRIYLKDNTQEICLVHSDGFWVRTKSREEIHRTSPREVQVPQPQETVPTKKKRNGFYGLFQSNGRAVKREQNAIVVESPRVFVDSQGNYQQATLTEIVTTQPFPQQLDLSQMSNSASSYGSNSYLSNSGGFALQGVSPISNQIQMQNDSEMSSSLGSTPNNNSHLSVSQQSMSTTDVAEILRNLSIQNNHGHHSRNSSFTSPNGLASSCSSTSSSSYMVPNSTNSTDLGFQSLLDPQPGEPIDNTISKLDAAIQFFSTMKDAYLKIKNNQVVGNSDVPSMGELCAQFSSSLQDKRGKDKGFKRVRQGNESGAVSPQSNHSGKNLIVPFRTASSSSPNTNLNMNGTSPLINTNMIQYSNTSFNGNGNNVIVNNQGMQFNSNYINTTSLHNLPMKNFDGDLPHALFNSTDNDANQDIFNL